MNRWVVMAVSGGHFLFSPFSGFSEPLPSSSYENRVSLAYHLIDAGDYEEAVRILQLEADALQSTELSLDKGSSLRYLLAYAYYQLGKWEDAIALFLNGKGALFIYPQERFLLALAYTKQGKHSLALEQFKKYLEQISSQGSLDLQQEMSFALGCTHFALQDWKLASENFENVSKEKDLTSLFPLAQIYLARIDFEKRHLEKAKKRLDVLADFLDKGDPLHYEVAFWQGEIASQGGYYFEASEAFKRALPLEKIERAAWAPDVLSRLALTYLKLVKESSDALKKKEWLDLAEEASLSLCKLKPEQHASFLLAECYLMKWQLHPSSENYDQLEMLLNALSTAATQETKARILLFRIETTKDPQQKQLLLQRLLENECAETSCVIQGWRMKGAADFEEGKRLLGQGPSEKGNFLLDQALNSFKVALHVAERGDDHPLISQLTKAYVEAALLRNAKENLKFAFASLEKEINQKKASVSAAELLYLKGRVASQLANGDDAKALWEEQTEKAWKAAIETKEAGPWAEQALYSLGTLYFQQQKFLLSEEQFLSFYTLFPHSSLAGEALYFSSRCAEYLQKDPQEIRRRRQLVWMEHPESSSASEAYFHTYALSQYLQGDVAAVNHLQAMPKHFPESPWLIPAFYLKGLSFKKDPRFYEQGTVSKRELQAAVEAFHHAETFFDSLNAQDKISSAYQENLAWIRHRAKLERAITNGAIGQGAKGVKRTLYLEYAVDVLKELLVELSNEEGTFNHSSYAAMAEEAEYALGHLYAKLEDDERAGLMFQKMLEKYQNDNITRGYYLSKVWKSVGQLKLKEHKYALALQAFSNAEDALKGESLHGNQKLELWILQSDCCREMKQWDSAMRLLSKVINDQEASNLRLKAMYLRAEVYEEQGRQELAQKQLEALSKKGGAWGVKAKEKLDQIYGF